MQCGNVFAGGNLFKAKPEIGRYDASFGLFIENKGSWTPVPGTN